MKIVAVIILAVIAFFGTVVGALFLSGNLSEESLNKLFTKKFSGMTPSEVVEDLDTITSELKKREGELKRREGELAQAETRLEIERTNLQELFTSLQNILKDIDASLADVDQGSQERLKALADTVGSMDAASAAKVLDELSPDEAATILLGIEKERTRATILDEMEPKTAVEVIRVLQAPPL
jgi:flagellar motility protein MotE (MotC chaperone)